MPPAPSTKLHVALLFGGQSAEHEISILSALFVAKMLDRARYVVTLIGIDDRGRWRLQDESWLMAQPRDPRLARLDPSGAPVLLDGARLRFDGKVTEPIDVVFPVLHGPMGEDGSMQGLLALADLPCVGAGVLGSAVGMDKDVMKRLLEHAKLPVLPYKTLRRSEFPRALDNAAAESARAAVLRELETLGYPLFVKPANLGSSVGISRARSRAELEAALEHALTFDTKLVIEKGVPGARELECAVLGNDDPVATLPGEIVITHADGYYSYAAKYIDQSGSELRIFADLSDAQARAMQALAVRTFRTLECAGLARVDFFLSDAGEIYVNEINTLPGFTAVSMFPKLWEASGLAGPELVSRLIDLALQRAAERRRLKTHAQPRPNES
jgi:D-alanine-D-alanine ligase